MLLCAVMAGTVALMSLLVEHLWDTLPGSPYFASPGHVGVTALILCVGAVLAFMMVWVEFTVIAQTSALTFMVAGTFKEIVTGSATAAVIAADGVIARRGLVCVSLCKRCLTVYKSPKCSNMSSCIVQVNSCMYTFVLSKQRKLDPTAAAASSGTQWIENAVRNICDLCWF